MKKYKKKENKNSVDVSGNYGNKFMKKFNLRILCVFCRRAKCA